LENDEIVGGLELMLVQFLKINRCSRFKKSLSILQAKEDWRVAKKTGATGNNDFLQEQRQNLGVLMRQSLISQQYLSDLFVDVECLYYVICTIND